MRPSEGSRLFFGRTALTVAHRASPLILVLACALVLSARIANGAPRTNDQIGALDAAETFGYAWARRDAEMGAATTDFGQSEGSPRPDALRGYFVGLSSPHHAAFAIESIKRTTGGYACALTLYDYLYAGHGHGDYGATKVTINFAKRGDVWKVVSVPGLYGA